MLGPPWVPLLTPGDVFLSQLLHNRQVPNLSAEGTPRPVPGQTLSCVAVPSGRLAAAWGVVVGRGWSLMAAASVSSLRPPSFCDNRGQAYPTQGADGRRLV